MRNLAAKLLQIFGIHKDFTIKKRKIAPKSDFSCLLVVRLVDLLAFEREEMAVTQDMEYAVA